MIAKLMLVVLLLAYAVVAPAAGAAAPAEPALQVSPAHLPGWSQDPVNEIWPAWQKSCRVLLEEFMWQHVCQLAKDVDGSDPAAVRRYFETQFVAEPLRTDEGDEDALITAYYEPVVKGSLTPDAQYRYPLFGVPADRMEGVPYAARADIDSGRFVPKAPVIAYLADETDRYFVHIQGSAKVALPDGSQIAVSYAGNNGQAYRSIGRILVEQGEIPGEQMSMQAIRGWLARHPERANELLWSNPRYIFFSARPATGEGPSGSMGLPLTPQRSVAIDAGRVKLGAPVWIETSLPGAGEPYRRLLAAQDQGAAIQGLRADIYFGTGDAAGQAAGAMKQRGKIWVLRPRYPVLMLAAAGKETP